MTLFKPLAHSASTDRRIMANEVESRLCFDVHSWCQAHTSHPVIIYIFAIMHKSSWL